MVGGRESLRPIIRRHWPIALAGALLGLAALTRSLALGFVPLTALLIYDVRLPIGRRSAQPRPPSRRSRAIATLAFLLPALLLVTPWTLYNSRLYGGPVVVDTSGAFNVLLGARTAFEGRREDAQVRDFVLALLGQPLSGAGYRETCAPDPGVLPNQAARQSAMMAEGLCLIAARPAAFVQKSLAELIDLFQINYTGAERFTSGFTAGLLPVWYLLGLFLLDDTLYVLTLPLGVLGWAIVRRTESDRWRTSPPAAVVEAGAEPRQAVAIRLSSLVGLWWLYNLATAPLLFAINRFRLPLMPFVFIFAAYAIVAGYDTLSRRRQERRAVGGSAVSTSRAPKSGWYLICGLLAGLLWLVAATPYAYLEPRAPGAASRWASYLGPYPSSLAITRLATSARPRGEADLRFAAALRAGDVSSADALLRADAVSAEVARLGPALIAAREGRHADVLELLPAEVVDGSRDVRGAVLRGDALRSLGDEAAARATFTQRYVDDANPVEWAWEWLRPAPTRRIDLGGNLDLGYIAGCYLGEGDGQERTTARWCSDGAQLRFPGAGMSSPQQLVLLADGRGWPNDMLPVPPVQVLLAGRVVGEFTPDSAGPREFTVTLPPGTPGADVLVTLRVETFVPGPERYLRQQSEQSLGQVHQLGVRLDWVELRSP